MAEGERTVGATWPDVGLALIAFAREDPVLFVLLLSILAAIVWFLVPRATMLLTVQTQEKIRDKERELSSSRVPDTPDDDR